MRAIDMCEGWGAIPIFYAVDVCLAVHVFRVHTFHQGPESKRIHILLPGDVQRRPFQYGLER